MNLYYMIKGLTDDEIKKILNIRIPRLEGKSKMDNDTDLIGFKISHNPVDYCLDRLKVDSSFSIAMRCFYNGYVPKDTKVVYGLISDDNGLVSNEGMYYTVDDDSYIYEFCKYIRDKDVLYEEDFFEYVLIFLKSYFGVFRDLERDDMFQLILKEGRIYHNPVVEHKLSSFKKKGNAQCSEYAIMASNILSVFGFDSCLLIGQLKTGDRNSEGHAFNIVSYVSEEKGREINVLLDFAYDVDVFDVNYNRLGNSPYIMYLQRFDEDVLNDIIYGDLHLTYPDYDYMVLGHDLLQLGNGRTRDYFFSQKLYAKNMSNRKQIIKSMI